MTDNPTKKLFLLDAYALIFRSYYAFIKNPRITSKGLNTSAIFGFLLTLEEVLQKQKPTHIAVVFDTPTPTFRHVMFKEYKANRDETPEDIKNPKNGMVMDFADLKTIVLKEIVNVFDHAVVVSKDFDSEKIAMFRETFGNTVVVDYQPTCENLVADFAGRIKMLMPAGTKINSLKLYETAKSYAEWFAEDNE